MQPVLPVILLFNTGCTSRAAHQSDLVSTQARSQCLAHVRALHTQMFRGLGWDVRSVDTRVDMVRDFGLKTSIVNDFATPAREYNSLFIVATPCGAAAE